MGSYDNLQIDFYKMSNGCYSESATEWARNACVIGQGDRLPDAGIRERHALFTPNNSALFWPE